MLTEAQIKYMVDRFLGWRLPENFQPDAGISFKPTFNDHMPKPMRHEPSGTNLFDATQANAMVRYMVAGMPPADSAVNETGWLIERYVNGELRYWCGRSADNFLPKNDEAIRFARAEDAGVVLAWLCGGMGRVAEHMWCGGPGATKGALEDSKHD